MGKKDFKNRIRRGIDYYMVMMKYPALYTDNLGCEQAEVYLFKDSLQLKVRNCFFKNDDFNFDFYTRDLEKTKSIFYLKDNELIEYFMDIKIPLILISNGIEYVKEFLLRIERNKNNYSNSLSILLNGELYEAYGYDFKDLIKKMKNKLSKILYMEDNFISSFGINQLKTKKEEKFCTLEIFNKKMNNIAKKETRLNCSNIENKKNYENLQKIPVMNVSNKYYSS